MHVERILILLKHLSKSFIIFISQQAIKLEFTINTYQATFIKVPFFDKTGRNGASFGTKRRDGWTDTHGS